MAIAKYVTIIAALALAGCQTTKEPVTAVVTVEKAPLVVPTVDNIKIQDVEWYVIKRDAKSNQEGSTEQAFGKSHSDSLLAITPRGYENLALNQANLVKIISHDKHVIWDLSWRSGLFPSCPRTLAPMDCLP